MTIKYDYKTHTFQIDKSPHDIIDDYEINKDTSFTKEERDKFKLWGLLPATVHDLEKQINARYQQLISIHSPLRQYIFLSGLQDANQTLFYALLKRHVAEILPIVYTPTIGDAVENYSTEFRRARGLFISYEDKDRIPEILDSCVIDRDIRLALVTDGEGVLGIGDWGVGGIDIAIGKLTVYTACGGVNPMHCLPIQLDVGTNNQKLLDDPSYLGWRHKRISGKEYYDFIDSFVAALTNKFPGIFLHWEDLGRDNARNVLLKYRDKITTFNDDMQGTGATALASLLSALNVTGEKLEDQRIVFLGAGTAGTGIADQMANAMITNGLSDEEAHSKIHMVDRQGLLLKSMEELAFFQEPYAKTEEHIANWDVKNNKNISLLEVIKNHKPTVLIGCSTVKGAFNEEIVREMAKHVEYPIIFPLSNPSHLAEAVPKDLLEWTDGKALIATGSPFENTAQCNNSFVFPGLGLGVLASHATTVSDGMIWAACEALAHACPTVTDSKAQLLPNIEDSLITSKKIAIAVAKRAIEEGHSKIKLSEVEMRVNEERYNFQYPTIENI